MFKSSTCQDEHAALLDRTLDMDDDVTPAEPLSVEDRERADQAAAAAALASQGGSKFLGV